MYCQVMSQLVGTYATMDTFAKTEGKIASHIEASTIWPLEYGSEVGLRVL